MKFSFHLIRYPVDNAKVFQRVSMNLNMTVVHCEKCFYNFWMQRCARCSVRCRVADDGSCTTVKELKGLNIVQRDWCDLAKVVGK